MGVKVEEQQLPPTKLAAPGSGNRSFKVILTLGLIGLIVFGFFGSQKLIGTMGEARGPQLLTHKVARGDLLVTVTEDGNVESASNVDIKCQVAGGTSVLWIIEDGTHAKKGDKLVSLDASALEEQINSQKIVYEKARSAKIQAEKTLAVAKMSVTEYLQGTFKQALQDQDALVTIGLENLRSAQTALEHAERMFRKGYISSLELESQKFAVERSQLELDSAETAKEVLVNFTKPKMLEDLKSQEATSEALVNSETAAFELEEAKLKRLESQMESCEIYAPADGMVVYANPRGGRFGSQQTGQIEEGAAVREQQTILRLPDLDQMQVKVNVHESKIDQIRPGLRARIRILDREVTGTVKAVANQPEPSSFFSANVKEYATTVRINGKPEGLRPGMTAEVEILVAHVKDALTLPVASVVERRREYFCWVNTPNGPERRPLVIGQSDDKFIEIKDGVAEGEDVLLNPRAAVPDARKSPESTEDENVSDKFGEGEGPTPGPPTEGAQRRGRGGPGEGGGRGREGGGDRRGGGRSGAGGSGAAGGSRGVGGRFDLSRFDKDGDGKVSKDEAPAQMRSFFDRLDSNGDGFIDKAERDAMRKRMSSGGGGGGGGKEGPSQ